MAGVPPAAIFRSGPVRSARRTPALFPGLVARGGGSGAREGNGLGGVVGAGGVAVPAIT
jgi:hypothetical protein